MKSVILTLFLFFTFLTINSQDKKEIAKVYYKKAVKSFNENDFEKTNKYLTKNVEYFGGIENDEIATFGANFYFKNKNYVKAKEYIKAYFTHNKDRKSDAYNKMLLLYTETLDAIESPVKIKKTKKIISPKVIKIKKEVKISNNNSSESEGNAAVKIENKESLDDGDEIEIKDIPFSIIEDVPVFPGCYGDKSELKNCFNKMIQVHFATFFNADLPNNLGLSKGKKKVFIGFRINTKGTVDNILVRAPHPKLKEEVTRVMKLLPIIKPGTQRGKNVNVKYSIPFTLVVD